MADEYRMEKLNSENYRHWSLRAQGLLEAKGCWSAIDPGFGDETTSDHKVLDHKAKSIFYMIVNDASLDDIAECKTAKEIWETLKGIYTKFDTFHGLLLVKDFVTTEKKPDETVGDYLTRRNALYHKVKNAGFCFEEKTLAGFAVLGLPREYEYLIRNLRMDNDDLTMKSLKSKLTEEERRIISSKTFSKENYESFDENKALMMKRYHKNEKRVSYKEKKDTDFTRRSQEYLRCYRCLEFGHIAKNCTYDTKNEREEKSSTKFATSNENSQHILLKTTKTKKDNVWILDSGSTDHMTSQRQNFITFKEEKIPIKVAGGGVLFSAGRGNFKLTLSTQSGGRTFMLVDALYVPELDGNLLSATKIAEKGMNIKMSENKAEIMKNEESVAIGLKDDEQLYCFYEKIGSKSYGIQNFVHQATSKKTDMWHRRLGHLHLSAIRKLLKGSKNLVQEKCENTTCEICMMGKLKAKPFPKKSETREKQPLRLIHSDVVGPIKPMSNGGNNYFVTFIDDYSRYTEVYMMKNKSEVPEKFDIYRKKVENFHETKIKILRSDNGGEYMGKEFIQTLKNLGIERQLTIPNTPQQNGVAERANQTLMDMARCVLLESGLPMSFWAEAVATACYIRNRCPTSANDNVTPLELWRKKKSKIEHLKVFGCRAWAVNRKRNGKFSPKGIPYIFIGYDDCAKAYKLWQEDKNEVTISRDVNFEEENFPFKIKKENHKEKLLEDIIWNTLEIECSPEELEENNLSTDEVETESVSTECDSINEQSVIEDQITRSGRTVAPPVWTKDYIVSKFAKCNQLDVEDPQTPDEALARNDSEKWKNAMIEEFRNLLKNNSFEFVARPKNRRTIKGKWVLKTKHDENGELVRYRARIVALGNTQKPGLDYDKTYSPVVQTKTTRILFGIAAEKGWKVHHLDITAAYLIADIDEEVYMEIPQHFYSFIQDLKDDLANYPKPEVANKDGLVWKLRKAIYGLHQSGRLWNRHLDAFLKSQGLQRSRADPCVYYKRGYELIVTIFVDDIVLYGKPEEIERMKRSFKQRFDVKDLGEAKHILSIRVRQTKDGISLDQSNYVKKLLKDTGMQDCKTAKTPLNIGVQYKVCEEGEELRERDADKYRHVVGSLLYLATHTRPDLAFPATYMSQFCQKPSNTHWTGVQHILRYLNGTQNLSLVFKKTNETLKVYTDADWGSNVTDRRSFSGYIVKFGGSAVSWMSRKQRCTALSTVEAEFIALSEAGKECTWLRNLLQEIGQNFVKGSMIINIDNQGAIKLAENPTTSDRSKHIDLKVFHVRDLVESQTLQLKYVQSNANLADQLTKVLASPKMQQHLSDLGIMDPGGVLDVAQTVNETV